MGRATTTKPKRAAKLATTRKNPGAGKKASTKPRRPAKLAATRKNPGVAKKPVVAPAKPVVAPAKPVVAPAKPRTPQSMTREELAALSDLTTVLNKMKEFEREPRDVERWARADKRSWIQTISLWMYALAVIMWTLGISAFKILQMLKQLWDMFNGVPISPSAPTKSPGSCCPTCCCPGGNGSTVSGGVAQPIAQPAASRAPSLTGTFINTFKGRFAAAAVPVKIAMTIATAGKTASSATDGLTVSGYDRLSRLMKVTTTDITKALPEINELFKNVDTGIAVPIKNAEDHDTQWNELKDVRLETNEFLRKWMTYIRAVDAARGATTGDFATAEARERLTRQLGGIISKFKKNAGC